MLTWYFAVPIVLSVVLRIWKEQALCLRKVVILSLLGFFVGLWNPFYFFMFLVLRGAVGLGKFAAQNWGLVCVSVAGGISGITGFFMQNLDTFLLWMQEGPNPAAVSRDLWWMVKFGMYLPDMVLPKFYIWEELRHFGGKFYHYKIPQELAGEAQTAYIVFVR
ncbi:MAG: hypothetical protein NZL93_02270 [Chthoniobacterales bacterium]|nr:hypothetical protein [Chthoniobacterales bacterium]